MKVVEITDRGYYLAFKLGEDRYALEILKVREVQDYTDLMKMPGTPDFMRGILNLRGNAVPVIDLKLKFGMTKTERTVDTCIIITDVHMDNKTTTMGLLVDSVQEVLILERNQIAAAPKFDATLNTEVIKGMGKLNDSFIMILDIDKVFETDEMDWVNNTDKVISKTDGSTFSKNKSFKK